jgi:hydrophobe/amphiphile efflux-1 (HAE1) family protein
MGLGLPAKEATIKAMEEITGPVIGITLTLAAVFIPTAFIPGLSGQFFRQFALTIASAAFFSAVNALTMAPARAVAWIKPHGEGHGGKEALPPVGIAALLGLLTLYVLSRVIPQPAGPTGNGLLLWGMRAALFAPGAIAGWFLSSFINRGLGWFFGVFNKAFDLLTRGYSRIVGLGLRLSVVVLIVYGGLLALTGFGFATAPTGFIPEQDQSYLLVNVDLPQGASVQRSQEELDELSALALKTPGVKSTMAVAGYSAVFACNSSNWGTIFVILDDFENRRTPETQAEAIIEKLNREYHAKVLGCRAAVFGAPPVPGLGQSGGFQLQIEDRTGLGYEALQEATETLVKKANAQPGLARVYTTFSAKSPQLYLEIDREAAKQMGVTMHEINTTLNANMGSVYVNQFNRFGRIWQVNVQAEGEFRTDVDNLKLLQVRNRQGQPVPLGSMLRVRYDSGPVFVMRYNNMTSSAVNGATQPGFSSGQALSVMDKLSDQNLPSGMGHEWTNISFQEYESDKSGLDLGPVFLPMVLAIFAFAVMMVFLVLAALYESWSLPLAIILVVPMCLLSAIAGLVWMAHMSIDIFCQIGFIVLVALAAKNAILIVEYAVDQRKKGLRRYEATVEACRLRLRPILMTSFAFILGVYPLVVATGAGHEMRHSLGMAVISGMIGVSLFGIFLTPVFYYVVTWFGREETRESKLPAAKPESVHESPAQKG